MNIPLRQQLAGLLEIADQMQVQAADNDWDGVARLREQFQQCAAVLFAGPVNRDELPAIGELIRRVSEINDGVIALCRNARDARRHDLDNLKQGRRAISSYSANTG